MALVPPVSEHCNLPMTVTQAQLECHVCRGAIQPLTLPLDIGSLVKHWPQHCDEYKSLRRRIRCEKCGAEAEEFFPYGRAPLDFLPGTYEKRVFIGGNYDLMATLRNIKSLVLGVAGDFVPILPYDDFQIPQGRIYEWDLRFLHNCKYAVFEVTNPAGELFEIARCAEYNVLTLLVYQARGATAEPPRARTMLTQSGAHEHRSYTDQGQLATIIEQFLLQKNPLAWKRSVDTAGYHFGQYEVINTVHGDGTADHECSYLRLEIDASDLTLPELTHDFRITSGRILPDSFRLVPAGGRVSWRRDSASSSERAEFGVVQFRPPLKSGDRLDKYTFQMKTEGAYILSKEDLARIPEEERDDPFLAGGTEFASREIQHPTETFTLQVRFPEGYPVDPRPVAYFGAEYRPDGIRVPPDSFKFENNVAILVVKKPTIRYRYGIVWEVPRTWKKPSSGV